MPGTHVSLHYHLVYSTKDRRPLIGPVWRERLHAYLGGMVRTLNGTALAVGGTPDHVHMLVGLRATHQLSNVLREVKGESSRWVHEALRERDFGWEDGYGAFTVGRSELDRVREYIARQEEHHRTTSFQEEYRALLQEHGVEYDERYLW